MDYAGNVTAVIGKDLAGSLGKKGTASDVTLYNHKINDTVLAFIEPSSYPDKIQSLISALNIADDVLLKVTEVTPYLAETIVALDLMNMKKGYVIYGKEVQKEMLSPLMKGTVVSGYQEIEEQPMLIKEKLAKDSVKKEGEVIVQIDHSFNVKSVGTVALGVVKRGVLKKHDELTIYPGKKKASIRSIQVNDVDVEQAASGVRVGLALKNLTPEDVGRGAILSKAEIKTYKSLEADATLTKYSARGLKIGDCFTLNSALNYAPAKVASGSVSAGSTGRISIELEKETPVLPDSRIVFLDPGQKMPRVFGYASI